MRRPGEGTLVALAIVAKGLDLVAVLCPNVPELPLFAPTLAARHIHEPADGNFTAEAAIARSVSTVIHVECNWLGG